jgi:AcrR family transcriptional regulator
MATTQPAETVRRPRISRKFLEEHRRRRFVEACAEILHEFGRRGATASNVIRVAGTARNSFYEVFSSVEDCIGYGVALAEGELFAALGDLDGSTDWADELHRAIAGFYEAVAARPTIAELFLVHAAASRAEPGRLAFRDGGERLAPLIGLGGAEAGRLGRRPPPEAIAGCLSRAVVALAAARVRGPQVAALAEEAAPMAELVLGYYLGADAALEALGPDVRRPAARRG